MLPSLPAPGQPASDTVDFVPARHGDSVLSALAAPGVTPPARLTTADGYAAPSEHSRHPAPTVTTHRYTFAGEIARGGMGAVLRGHDADLGRDIAVKVLLPTHKGKTQFLNRFIEEAQIGGQLQHPGVVPVYELGRFSDDRPYFTMKLVEGETLAKLLKERAAPQADRPRFLKIFEQICQTLAYAHSRGVIHRDLKPHNVMVGAFGEVQVMDWGLAKQMKNEECRMTNEPSAIANSENRYATSPVEHHETRAGTILGTPAYMPPEQARGEVAALDARSDVFSLGAMLCEILTGQPPYGGTLQKEVLTKAAQAELTEAFAQLATCGADAELIALAKRCLAAAPADRPDDAGALTRELTAYLQGVDERLRQAELAAVAARTKAVEETKRRRITFRLAAGILLALLAGLTASLWQMNRALAAEGLAKTNEDKAVQLAAAELKQRLAAQQRLDQVEKGSDLLTGIFKAIDIQRIRSGPENLEVVLGRRLKEAAQQLRGQSIGDPLVVAKLQHTLGGSLLGLGYYQEALPLLQECSRTYQQHFGQEDRDTLAVLNNLATAYQFNAQFDRAIPLFEQIRAAQLRLDGPDDVEALVTLNNLALAHYNARRPEQALPLLKEVYEARLRLFGPDHPDTLLVLNNLAGAYLTVGQPHRAIPLFEKARTAVVAKFGPVHPAAFTLLGNLADAYSETGQLQKALGLLEPLCPAIFKHLGAEHPETLSVHLSLGMTYLRMQQPAQALPALQLAARGFAQRKFRDANAGSCVSHLIDCHEKLGQLDEAALWWRKWLSAIASKSGPQSWQYGVAMAELGQNLLRQQKYAEAEQVLRDALRIQEKNQPDAWTTHNTRSLLGGALLGQRKHTDAEPFLLQGYEGMRRQPIASIHPTFRLHRQRDALERLVQLYEALGNTEAAAKWKQELAAEEAKTKSPGK